MQRRQHVAFFMDHRTDLREVRPWMAQEKSEMGHALLDQRTHDPEHHGQEGARHSRLHSVAVEHLSVLRVRLEALPPRRAVPPLAWTRRMQDHGIACEADGARFSDSHTEDVIRVPAKAVVEASN